MIFAEASGLISFLPELAPELIYTISFWTAIVLFIVFFSVQYKYFRKTESLIAKYTRFFAKESKNSYYTYNASGEVGIANIARKDSYLHELIADINQYLSTCKGSASFGIIHNKTERRLTMRYDEATADMSFPTHLGLMGTFVGVFIGLFFFLWASSGPDGITDEAIHSLITGVLVSMSTSFVGLLMSIMMTAKASKARTVVDGDKNDFYEFVQNDVMGKVDTNLSDALASLHQTVATFEPQFSSVIRGFKETFQECTRAFGSDFRKSVSLLVNAVDQMGNNMEVVNKNVDLLKELIQHMSSGDMVRYMRSFSEAADHIKVVTASLSDFERARRMMLAAAQESINIQKAYNEQLKVPLDVAAKINTIMTRITRFEENINKTGEALGKINMVSDAQIEALNNIINAIKEKHRVALDFGNTANTKLETYFNDQVNMLKNMHGRYITAFEAICKQYEELVEKHSNEINMRHEDFKASIDAKFNLEECRQEFAELRRIHVIEATTRRIDDKTMSAETLSKRFNKLETAIGDSQKSKGLFGLGGTSKSKGEDKPVKTGTAKPYAPSAKPEKSAKDLLREMGLDKENDDNPSKGDSKAGQETTSVTIPEQPFEPSSEPPADGAVKGNKPEKKGFMDKLKFWK